MTPSGRANEDDRSEGNPLFNRRRPDRISLGPISDAYHTIDADFVLSECDRCVLSDQRVFYLHRAARRSYWEPPHAAWQCAFGLPYGYERAVDEFGSIYYINHLTQRKRQQVHF
ncbi:FERM and PDZ domain-containing protein 4 isoform X3 [Aphelenchoides fujianensis]|nr:FERM and PDZ domain-containing protein 4 isoform X3 [Aphelenchoides fujianensis]